VIEREDAEQKEESNPPPTAESSVGASIDALSIDPKSGPLPPALPDNEDDAKMGGADDDDDAEICKATVTVSELEAGSTGPVVGGVASGGAAAASAESDDDYLEMGSATLAVTRSRRQRTKVSYRDESSSEEEESSDEDSEAGNPLFAGLSKAERAAMKLKMAELQSQHSEQARKEREQALEEIVSSFEFNIGETVSKEEAGFIHDFCTKHQVDVNDKIEDEGDFFLMSMREMIEERMMEIKNGIRGSSRSVRNQGGDSESEFDADEYDDDSDDSEYDVDSDWDDPGLDHENLVSDDEYSGFVVGGGGGRRKKKRRKNVWVDADGREYHCKGRLLLDDALKDTVNFEGWSAARVQAWKNKAVNPNAYYYRFNDPGEEQQNGRIREDEHSAFMQRVIEHGVNFQWGIFSKTIKGRVGYQCSNYWRQMMKDGWVKDPNYWIRADGSFQYKRAKKGSIPDAIRRYSFVVTHDPSKLFHPLPGTHPKRPSDSKLAKYLQSDVKGMNEKKKKGGNKKKGGKKGKEQASGEEEAADTEKAQEESKEPEDGADSKSQGDGDGDDAEAEAVDEKEEDEESSSTKKGKKSASKKKKKKEKKERKRRSKKKKGGVSGDEEEEEVESTKRSKKEKKSRAKRKKKKSKESESDQPGSDSKSSKKSRGKKRKHSGRKDELEPPQKKRKRVAADKSSAEEEAEDDPMAVLKGMVDMMTGEAMVKPAISPYGHVMEYDSWCSILRSAKTKNRCPFTNGKITRRQLVKLDADNIDEYKDRIVNITADQMGCLES